MDLVALEASLRAAVRGEVRFDAGSRGAYSTDSSNFRQVPLGVVVPRDVEDIAAAVAACRSHGAPLTNRGGGTSLSGETTNVAVILDSSKYMTALLELDPDQRFAWVEPGIITDTLREAAKPHGLIFGPDPSTHDRCTIGGNIGNNSCGVHSIMSGRTADNTLALDVVLYDGTRMIVKSGYSDDEIAAMVAKGGRQGEIFSALRSLRDRYSGLIRQRFPVIPRRVSGYNLDNLLPENGFNVAASLVGTEGTCATILRAKLALVPWPTSRSLLVLGYGDIAQAADHVPEIMRHQPQAIEAVDHTLISNMLKKQFRQSNLSLLPEGSDYLLLEFGGDSEEDSDQRAMEVMAELRKAPDVPAMSLFDDMDQEETLWKVRESGLGATAMVPGEPDTWPGWEDSAVAPERMGDYIRDLRKLVAKYDYTAAAMYGHFGEGCLHSRIPFDLVTAKGVKKYRSFMEEAADLVISYGGSLSGEHGDGQQRAELLDRMYGPELVQAFREFKAIWDPDNRMNPGKVVDPIRVFKLDENLRLGTNYRPSSLDTYFAFPNDGGSFEHATLRCVGVGKCRVEGGQTMCPSYMTLREEEHSTRGRARLLFEMLQGDVVTEGWRSTEVFDALNMCLSCKGCKNDCPINVDMATYKSEFLAHYYEGRLRPRCAYAMGLIMYAARVGSRVPRLANFALHAPGVSSLVKKVGGVHPDRQAPHFAGQSFRQWFERRPRVNAGKPKVVLFPDTFNNFFHVDVAQATCEVLEAAGFEVVIPRRVLCCGRPLFDYGMLKMAQRLYRQVLTTLRAEIAAGIPMVVPEPSCCASFRDELVEMSPHDHDARRLSQQTFTLEEFLENHAPHWQPPRAERNVLVQSHCHHKSIMGMDAEQSILSKMGAEHSMPATGCCGLAGSWGFEQEKYETSMQCGERVLFPAVRESSSDTIIVADGFSCRTQIAQGTERRAVHLAQLIRSHLAHTDRPMPTDIPERAFDGTSATAGSPPVSVMIGSAASAIGLGLAVKAMAKRRPTGGR